MDRQTDPIDYRRRERKYKPLKKPATMSQINQRDGWRLELTRSGTSKSQLFISCYYGVLYRIIAISFLNTNYGDPCKEQYTSFYELVNLLSGGYGIIDQHTTIFFFIHQSL